MSDEDILKQKLSSIDGQDYGSYQALLGAYDFSLFKLVIQQIPKDPYAPPHAGVYRIQVPQADDRINHLNIGSRVTAVLLTFTATPSD